MNKLLLCYIRLALREAQQARVPNQLLSSDDTSDEPSEDGIEELNAIATGGLMGHAGTRHAKKDDDR